MVIILGGGVGVYGYNFRGGSSGKRVGSEGEGESTRTGGGGCEQHEGVVVPERVEPRGLIVHNLRARRRDAASREEQRGGCGGGGGGRTT